MPLPTDAALIAALDAQYRRLDMLVSRLEVARVTLVPPSPTFWLGAARLAYDSAFSALEVSLSAAIAALSSAQHLTEAAHREVLNRGC